MKGQEIRTIRQQLGLSQRDFAKRLGVSKRSIRRWENGHSNPKGAALEKLVALQEGDTFAKEDTLGGDTSQKGDTFAENVNQENVNRDENVKSESEQSS